MTKKTDREYSRKEKLAGYFYDLSKLTFTALVLGMLVVYAQQDAVTPKLWFMFAGGVILTVFFSSTANKLLK